MNIDKTHMLAEMGIKPAWRLRAPLSVAFEAEALERAPTFKHGIESAGVAVAQSVIQTHGESPTIASLNWDELESGLREHSTCPACKLAVRAVMGAGNRQAEWMFVGDESADQNQVNEALSGQAARLLDAMLEAIAVKRGQNAYLVNVAHCSVPAIEGLAQSAGPVTCNAYLAQQIALVKPKVLIVFGPVAMRALLGESNDSRGTVHRFGTIPVVVTHAPEALLRSPADKAGAWEDLCLAMDQIARP